MKRSLCSGSAVMFAAAFSIGHAHAAMIYQNDFETNTNGFTAGGVIPSLNRTSLPTDGAGMNSTNRSNWLGKIGAGIAKSNTREEIVTLQLSGLSAGTTYDVAFDLLIGASWDGSATFYGQDSWRFSVDGTKLVDTTFSDGNGSNMGAYSPQCYSDTTYLTTTSKSTTYCNKPRFTGAEYYWSANQSGNYANDYSVYFFGSGNGNPMLSFVAMGSSAVLEFARYTKSTGSGSDSGDEYWALDNVKVTGPDIQSINAIPEPGTLVLLALGLLGLGAARSRKEQG